MTQMGGEPMFSNTFNRRAADDLRFLSQSSIRMHSTRIAIVALYRTAQASARITARLSVRVQYDTSPGQANAYDAS
jgi:hypothetical protein